MIPQQRFWRRSLSRTSMLPNSLSVMALLFLVIEMMGMLVENTEAATFVQVKSPKTLAKDQGYAHIDSLFGILPPLGGRSMQNPVFYNSENPLLCDGPDMDWTRNKLQASPYFLVVDRGECSFVTKVRNAQAMGASGVFIANHLCLCSDRECIDADSGICEAMAPIAADDGTGEDVTIPSIILLYKQDGDRIKQAIQNGLDAGDSNHMVVMELANQYPSQSPSSTSQQGTVVNYGLWFQAGDWTSPASSFLDDFQDYAMALGDAVSFTPHYLIEDGTKEGCTQIMKQNQQNQQNVIDQSDGLCNSQNCTNAGRYCSSGVIQRNGQDGGINGAAVILESLRQACLWVIYGSAKQGADGFDMKGGVVWEYVQQFNRDCAPHSDDDHPVCVDHVLSRIGVDSARLNKCIKDYGGVERDVVNALLENQLRDRASFGIYAKDGETLTINGRKLSLVVTQKSQATLTAVHAFQAICKQFAPTSQPEICVACPPATSRDPKQCVLQFLQAKVEPTTPQSRPAKNNETIPGGKVDDDAETNAPQQGDTDSSGQDGQNLVPNDADDNSFDSTANDPVVNNDLSDTTDGAIDQSASLCPCSSLTEPVIHESQGNGDNHIIDCTEHVHGEGNVASFAVGLLLGLTLSLLLYCVSKARQSSSLKSIIRDEGESSKENGEYSKVPTEI